MPTLRCPACAHGRLAKTSTGMICPDCSAQFPVVDGYLDFFPQEGACVTPIQRIMQFPPAVAIYEAVWRPLGDFIGSQRSFERDADQIAASVRADRGAVLDLACGPLARHSEERTRINYIFRATKAG